MSLFNDASLVMIPSGYKTSKVYSVKPDTGAGDLTFTRTGDTATRVGPDGLIEKVRTNQALWSEDFTNAYWIKANATITGNTIANPIDGALTADTFTPTNVSATNRIRSASISLPSAGMSIYVKANGYTKVGIREDITSGNYASYDLSSGTILDSSGVVSPTITALANGWYRISLGVTASPVGMGVWILDPTYTTGTFSTSNWTADGTSGIYVFGAQIEGGDIATDYIATTTAAVSVGPVANVPRLDYLNSSCPRLLLEPQRTNIQLNSEIFDNASWSKTNSAVVANQILSPDGYVNADKLNETATTGLHQLEGTRTTTAATAYTMSVFAKKGERDFVRLYEDTTSNSAYFNLNTGVVGTVSGPTATAKIEDYGNGWYRCSVTYTETGTFGRFRISVNSTNGTASYLGVANNGIYLWGAQFEVGAYATSYIPTLGAAVTRGADAASKTGISSLIGQTEGTLFVEITTTDDITTVTPIGISDGTASNRVLLYVGSGILNALVTVSGVAQATISSSSISANTRYKMAIAYKANDFAFYVNGVQIGVDTSGTVPACSKFNYDNGSGSAPFYGLNNQALLFKTRLTNAQLAELTA